jgi:hypothetical protein
MSLHRWDTPTEPTGYMLAPSICLIGQGRKPLFLGEAAYVYDADRFLLTSSTRKMSLRWRHSCNRKSSIGC